MPQAAAQGSATNVNLLSPWDNSGIPIHQDQAAKPCFTGLNESSRPPSCTMKRARSANGSTQRKQHGIHVMFMEGSELMLQMDGTFTLVKNPKVLKETNNINFKFQLRSGFPMTPRCFQD
jgi:hypothetical protein